MHLRSDLGSLRRVQRLLLGFLGLDGTRAEPFGFSLQMNQTTHVHQKFGVFQDGVFFSFFASVFKGFASRLREIRAGLVLRVLVFGRFEGERTSRHFSGTD